MSDRSPFCQGRYTTSLTITNEIAIAITVAVAIAIARAMAILRSGLVSTQYILSTDLLDPQVSRGGVEGVYGVDRGGSGGIPGGP